SGTIKITKDTTAAQVPFDKLVVYFGTAKVSSGAFLGGARTGLYKSSNGGKNWVRLDPKTFVGLDIRSIVPSETDPNTILVAAQNTGKRGGGVYLSTDGGKKFTRVLKGNVTH